MALRGVVLLQLVRQKKNEALFQIFQPQGDIKFLEKSLRCRP